MNSQGRMQQNVSRAMKMTQSAKLNQQQQLSLKLLALPQAELREAIYAAADKNPALEIFDDPFERGETTISSRRYSAKTSDYEHYSKSSDAKASDDFLAALESNADERESLTDHLLHQLDSMNLSSAEMELCTLLVQNLNEDGFHILAPVSLLQKMKPQPGEDFLDKCLSIVQKLDPVGICTANVAQSLLVQALDKPNCPKSALFLLKGHLDFLDPPVAEKVAKKANHYIFEKSQEEFNNPQYEKTEDLPKRFSVAEMKKALSFIKMLDPRPARFFANSASNFVQSDVFVEEIPKFEIEKSVESLKILADNSILVFTQDSVFKIKVSGKIIPRVKISEDFEKFSSNQTGEKAIAEEKFARDSVLEAKNFISGIFFREATLARATAEIVRQQSAFFSSGPRFLSPLRQKDVADTIGVHYSTISRMANGKFLSCVWGVFPLSYFFTNAVNERTTTEHKTAFLLGDDAVPSSKESVKNEIAAILSEHKNDKKQLSDQKITQILNDRGIKIARRTVAKYRAELNVASSFSRVSHSDLADVSK